MSEHETTGWPARHSALAAAGGEEWDQLHEALETDWKAAYSAAFVEIAISRGRSRENAESRPENIVDEALLSVAGHDQCPRRVAEADVRACERECE